MVAKSLHQCVFLSHSMAVSSFQGSQHSGSSLSLASTKVCSSMDEGDGPGSEGKTLSVEKDSLQVMYRLLFLPLHYQSFVLLLS